MSNRLQRLDSLIKKELGQIIFREVEVPKGVLVSVSRVEVSQDLSLAKVYVSVMPESRINEVFKALNKMIYVLQRSLNRRLEMRSVPRVKFLKEEEIKREERIEEIFRKIDNERTTKA